MLIEGSKILAAPRAQVWRSLNDPAFLKQTIPGCRRVSQVTPTEMDLSLGAAVGPIKTSFDTRLTITDVVEGRSYALSGQGDAGAAGSASGAVRVVLLDVDGGTQLDYSAETQVRGRVAQLGTRLIDSAARKFSEEFFANVARLLAPVVPDGSVAQVKTAGIPVPSGAPTPAGLRQGPDWVAGLVWKLALGCGIGAFAGTLVAGLLR